MDDSDVKSTASNSPGQRSPFYGILFLHLGHLSAFGERALLRTV